MTKPFSVLPPGAKPTKLIIQAFKIYIGHAFFFFQILIFLVLISLLQYFLTKFNWSTKGVSILEHEYFIKYGQKILISMPLGLIFVYLKSVTCIGVAFAHIQEYPELKKCFLHGFKRAKPLILAYFIVFLVTGAGIPHLTLPGLIIGLFLCLYVPIISLETLSAGKSCLRSKDLTLLDLRKVFSVHIGILILGAAVGLIFLFGFVDNPKEFTFTMKFPETILINLPFMFLYQVLHIAVTLLYFDLGQGKEGYDIPTLQQNLDPRFKPLFPLK